MMSDLRWRLGARMPGHDYRVFTTAFVDGTNPRDGSTKRFSLIEAVDWVNVIAVTAAHEVVLIRQYRPGVDEVCLEIPGGMVDDGESPHAAAARELAEETGYTSTSWQPLGVVAPNPAIQNNRLHSFLATGARPTQPQRLDGSEVIDVETAPLTELTAMLRDGRISHALVVAAFGHLAFRLHELGLP
ncbi:MAG TPA: NUDIX hydrolase [Kofleriaceae bacterium]|jgi:8-oxo-dGTP pyrophosphatase MutT (NUDIX family)|nr:NUDIX hydrolase [Kofleriaceae bacterium]